MPRAKPRTDENGDRQARYRGVPTVSMVYFVQAATLRMIKIGVTVDIADRLKTLQVGCPDELALIGVIRDRRAHQLERALHSRFHEHHVRGEWFLPHQSLLDYVALWPEERMVERLHVEVLHALGGPRPKRRALIIPWADAQARDEAVQVEPIVAPPLVVAPVITSRLEKPRPALGRRAVLAAYKAERGLL